MQNWCAGQNKYNENVTDVTIESGVTSIGNRAFYNCYRLVQITIPKGVTSIGQDAFDFCSSLPGIIIPESITSIGSCAFRYCSRLTEIMIPESVTSIGGGAFSGCGSLTSVTIQGKTPPTLGNNVFEECKFVKENIKGIHVPDGTITEYKTVWSNWTRFIYGVEGNAASGDDWTLNVDGILIIISDNGMQNWCSEQNKYRENVISVTIENGVTNISDEAFYNCQDLTNITIPGSVTSIGNKAFGWCKSLINITIPEGVASIGVSAFDCCSRLTEITIPGSVTSIGKNAFDYCGNLTRIDVSEGNPSYWSSAEGILFSHDQKTLIRCPEGKNGTYSIPESVINIGDYAFYQCGSLTEITIPESVTNIGDYAFCVCYSLTEITIPNGVTSISDYAFHYCWSLKEITIPSSVTSIGVSAFDTCRKLTGITIPSGVTSIADHAFSDCNSLAEITIPSSVTSIRDCAFFRCSSLTEITIPSGVTSIGSFAFENCSSLTRIDVSEGNPSYWSSSDGVLFSIDKKMLICYPGGKRGAYSIPESVTYIVRNAFSNCRNLTEITIPESVISITDNAFNSCSNLTKITIPNSVTSIEDYAFAECSRLTKITVQGETPPMLDDSYTFYECPWVGTDIKAIFVPKGKVETYQNDSDWSRYKENIAEGTAYIVTVNNGSRSGGYEPGATVTITADAPEEGKRFKGWKADSGDVTLADATSITTTFLMPPNAVTVTAEYESIETPPPPVQKFTVTVNNGSGGSDYEPGATVTITADAPEEGKKFKGWKTDSGDVTLADATNPTTTFTMPASAVTVTAEYENTAIPPDPDPPTPPTPPDPDPPTPPTPPDPDPPTPPTPPDPDPPTPPTPPDPDPPSPAQKFTVTVNGGSGGNDYESGSAVTITAAAPAKGKQFKEWAIESGNVNLADAKSATTTFIMPAEAVTLKAVYEDKRGGGSVSGGGSSGSGGSGGDGSGNPGGSDNTNNANNTNSSNSAANNAGTPNSLALLPYRIIDGANSTWILGSKGSLAIRGDGSFDKFAGAAINGTLLDSANYTASEGSTIIALKDVYLNTLPIGSYNLAVLWTDGAAAAVFTVAGRESANDSNANTYVSKTRTKDNEPQTGDNTPIEIYATLAMISGMAYLRMYFADFTIGMSEETKKELVARLVKWAKRGGKIRKYAAIAVIFVLLAYYHGIGKKMPAKWQEAYED